MITGKKYFFALLCLVPTILVAQQKQVCFTYDDLPVVSYGLNDSVSQGNLMGNLIRALTKNNVPAIGFVNEYKLFDNGHIIPFQVNLLKAWSANGLALGNHSYSHPDYNSTSFSTYTNDILKGENETRKILSAKGEKLEYFRHPYLRTGDTRSRADSLASFLQLHNYTVAPVTIDNDDYLFAVAYKRAKVKNDSALMKQIGNDYISYMERKLKYYEKQSIELFGRNINHILLLHSSLLNSDYTEALIVMFRKNNYAFISLKESLEDPVYKTPVTFFGKRGLSWIDRWALSLGKKGEFFSEDPQTPDYIIKLSQ
jgi:peptidoglycan/xylan/chitin deacetylase (PgdA/CDA1 family)